MTLSDFATFSTAISGLAVVVTLVFLLLQMRQNNRNQQSLIQQGRSARHMLTVLARTEPYLSEAVARVVAGDTGIDPSQRQAVSAWATAILWSHEDSFLQHRAGTLDAASFETDASALKGILALPFCRVQWRGLRRLSNGAYGDYVDRLMTETPAVKPKPNAHAQWQAPMAEGIAHAV